MSVVLYHHDCFKSDPEVFYLDATRKEFFFALVLPVWCTFPGSRGEGMLVVSTFGLKVYIISELDVTERAFSTYNDKARMWMQMDTEMVPALPVEEHHRLVNVHLQRPSFPCSYKYFQKTLLAIETIGPQSR
jgi:hypothetical protein